MPCPAHMVYPINSSLQLCKAGPVILTLIYRKGDRDTGRLRTLAQNKACASDGSLIINSWVPMGWAVFWFQADPASRKCLWS